MMTETEARELVEQELHREGDRLVVVDDLTREHDFGWVFVVNSAAWATSRDVRDAIPGAGVIIVDRADRTVHVGGGQPPDAFVERYRRARSPAFTVTLATASATSAIGDDLEIDITITNPTGAAIDIDGWLAVGDGLTFEVRGPDGGLRPPTRRDRAHREPRTLAPGASLRTFVDLSHHVDLEAIGRYQVTARVGAVASAPLSFERTLRISQRGSHSELFYGMQDLAAARRSLAANQPDEAMRWAGRGLAELSRGYHPRHAGVDTTPAEIAAAEQAWKAREPGAVERMIAALEQRVMEYQARHFHPNLASARGDLGIARTALASGDAKLAILRARGGLDNLGPHYAPDDVADDTGLKIAAANDRERAGALADAAEVLCAMLASRIALYERRWSDEL